MAPTRDDAFVAASSRVLGGPIGRHARAHPFWTPLRVVLALVVLMAVLGLVRTAPCSTGSWWIGDPYSDLCYSDVPLRYADSGLAERTVPYTDTQQRYPASTDTPPVAFAEYAAAVATHALVGWPDADARGDVSRAELTTSTTVRDEATTYFFVVALLLFGCAAVAAGLLVRGSGRRPWDAAAFAAAPTLLLAGTIGFDLLAVVMTVGTWWAWARERPVLAGVLGGLGVATAFWPAALLVALAVVGLRAGRRSDVGLALLAATTTWTLVQLPALRLGLDGWWQTVTPRLGEPPGYGSLWSVAADAGFTLEPGRLAQVVVLACVLVTVAVVAVARRVPSPRMAQVALVLLVGWLVVWPVYSPQQVLWLLPLAVLARPQWRDLLIWQAAEVGYFLAIWMHLSGATVDSGTVDRVYVTAIVLRIAAELWLAFTVVRDLRYPVDDLRDRPFSPAGSGRTALL